MSEAIKYAVVWIVAAVIIIGGSLVVWNERCNNMVTVTRSDGRETVEITSYGPGCGD